MRGATSGSLSDAGAGVGVGAGGAGALIGFAATIDITEFEPGADARWHALNDSAPSNPATPTINHELTRSSTKLLDERDANLFPAYSCDFVS